DEITDAVAVRVAEATRINLICDGFAPPRILPGRLRATHSVHRGLSLLRGKRDRRKQCVRGLARVESSVLYDDEPVTRDHRGIVRSARYGRRVGEVVEA